MKFWTTSKLKFQDATTAPKLDYRFILLFDFFTMIIPVLLNFEGFCIFATLVKIEVSSTFPFESPLQILVVCFATLRKNSSTSLNFVQTQFSTLIRNQKKALFEKVVNLPVCALSFKGGLTGLSWMPSRLYETLDAPLQVFYMFSMFGSTLASPLRGILCWGNRFSNKIKLNSIESGQLQSLHLLIFHFRLT